MLFFPKKKKEKELLFPQDFEELHTTIIKKVRPYTMTSPERIFGLIEAVKYIVKHNIEGDIVECGVWRGGSMMTVAATLQHLKNDLRHLYMYDTYEGMSTPSEEDHTYNNISAKILLAKEDRVKDASGVWAYASLEDVKQTMQLTGYHQERIHYVKGKVEDTIPKTLPSKIALLRLDTDWYESTKHELTHLFPLLAKGGVLIIDDYGFWKGSRKAVDEYFSDNHICILLNRMDETGRIAIKQ